MPSPSTPPISRPARRPFDWSTAAIAVIVTAAAAYVFMRHGGERFVEILTADFRLFLEMQPKVLAACLIAALVAVLLPRELIARWLGAESGFLGLVIAMIAGAILPGGPITVFPIAAALLAAGADLGVAIALITSWTLLGYSRALVWELPIFGLDFVIWRSVAAVPLPIIAGVLARLIARALARRAGA